MEKLAAKWGFTVHRQSLKKNVAFIEHELEYNKFNNTLGPAPAFSDGHYRKLLHDVYPVIAVSTPRTTTSSPMPTSEASTDKMMSFLNGLTKTITKLDQRLTLMDKRLRASTTSTKYDSGEESKSSMRTAITELATLSVKQEQSIDLDTDTENAADESDQSDDDMDEANENNSDRDSDDDDDDNDDDNGNVHSDDDTGIKDKKPELDYVREKRPRAESVSSISLASSPSSIKSSIMDEHKMKSTEQAAEAQRTKLKADKAVSKTTAMLTAALKKQNAALKKLGKRSKVSSTDDESTGSQDVERRRPSKCARK